MALLKQKVIVLDYFLERKEIFDDWEQRFGLELNVIKETKVSLTQKSKNKKHSI